jgi:hypothetical protein
MNDFPMPEDPPVIITAEKSFRAVSGFGIGADVSVISQPELNPPAS